MEQKVSQLSYLMQDAFYRSTSVLTDDAVTSFNKGDASALPDVKLAINKAVPQKSEYSNAYVYFPSSRTLVGKTSSADVTIPEETTKLIPIPYGQFFELILNPPLSTWNSFYFSQNEQTAIYVTNLGLSDPKAPLMLLELDWAKLQKTLRSPNGSVYLMSDTGDFISSDATELPNEVRDFVTITNISGASSNDTGSYMVYTQYVERAKLYFVYAVPKAYLTEKLNPFISALIIYLIICLIGGVLLILLISTKQYEPIDEILSMIKKDSPHDDEFGTIKSHIERAFETEKDSQTKEALLQLTGRTASLNALLKGRARTLDVPLGISEEDVKKFGFSPVYSSYITIAFEIENLGDLSVDELDENSSDLMSSLYGIIHSLLLESYGKSLPILDGELDGYMACLINLDDTEYTIDAISRYAAHVCSYLLDSMGITVTANVSDFCSRREDLPQLYDQIRVLSEFRDSIGTDRSVITFRDFDEGINLNNIDIYKSENYVHGLLDRHQYKEAVDELKRIIRLQDAPDEAEESERSSDYSRELAQKVSDYVDAHFTDPDLSVSGIAESLNVNMSYISRTFKAVTGNGILEYISAKRIAAACDLLKQGHSVRETSELVGYYTQRSFQRSFEKIMHVKPSGYRDLNE